MCKFCITEKERKRKFSRKVTKGEASKAVTTFGHYAEQQAKKGAKTGVKTVKSWFKKKKK